jgi:hypothetical protein
VPSVAAKVLRSDSVVLGILRDPVERFASAMRHEAAREWPENLRVTLTELYRRAARRLAVWGVDAALWYR